MAPQTPERSRSGWWVPLAVGVGYLAISVLAVRVFQGELRPPRAESVTATGALAVFGALILRFAPDR